MLDWVADWFPESFSDWPIGLQLGTIILLTFISEDLTCLGAALFAVQGSLSWGVAWMGSFLGIWIGDGLLYGLARFFGERLRLWSVAQRFLRLDRIRRAEAWFQRRWLGVLWICRWVPGTRLACYLAAGFVRLPGAPFLAITAITAMIWTVLIFILVGAVGTSASQWLERFEYGALSMLVLVLGLFFLGQIWQRSSWWPSMERIETVYDRWTRWEFWPPWLFYLPVLGYYLWFSIRYRGLTLPTAANPGIETGGMIGESKIALLRELMVGAAEFTARAYAVDGDSAAARVASFESILKRHQLDYPVIVKPDVGQRGSGVRLVKNRAEARTCLAGGGFRQIVQEYAPGPGEAGVFYYRFPDADRGKIFAITHKIFPTLKGDGQRSLRELIAGNNRARIMSRVYHARFSERLDEVLALGDEIRLVEAGNHAQGCVFRDGMFLCTEALERRIEAISRSVDGFYIGRYDLRYESEDLLKQGKRFRIVELNGASAEATSIYDPDNRLLSAYGTLFQQWGLVFAIGAANRALGTEPLSAWQLFRLWRQYQRESQSHPLAD